MNNIEFFISNDGTELIVQENGQFRTFNEKDEDLITHLYNLIRENYPDAFKALQDVYKNAVNFKYLMVRRFAKCNFSIFDNTPDVTREGVFHIEFVQCPLRGECKWENTICLPKFNTSLSDRELQILKLICENLEDSEIADRLFISVFTVNNHRRSIERKLCVSNKLGILKYAQENSLI